MITAEKEIGNQAFKAGDYQKAVNVYTGIINNFQKQCSPSDLEEYIKCFNNRCQSYMKTLNFESALEDANSGIFQLRKFIMILKQQTFSILVLKLSPGNFKALFRRAQIYKQLNKYEEALLDAKKLISMDPKNHEFRSLIKSLIVTVDCKVCLKTYELQIILTKKFNAKKFQGFRTKFITI